MKKLTLIALTLVSAFINSTIFAQEVLIDTVVLDTKYTNNDDVKDTTIIFNQKHISIKDSLSHIRVQVMDNDSNEYKKVYEGVFTDEQSIESVDVMRELGFNFPFMKKKNKDKMESHWAGFSYGKLTTSDNQMNLGETAGIPFDKGRSNEVMLNIMDGIIPIIGRTFGLTSGFGFNWRSYHLDTQYHLLKDDDGITKAFMVNPNFDYSYSRLRTLHLTIPLMIEWQPVFGKNKNFFMSAGVVGGWNVMSSYRVKYTNPDGDTINKVESKGLNTNPLSLDFMTQVGYKNIGIYAKYSPFGIFQEGKGPAVNAASLGLQFDF